jgi:hypothetical protein
MYLILVSYLYWLGSRANAIGITTGYGLDGRGVGIQGQEFSALHVVQTSFGARTAPYPISTGGGVKWPRREANRSPQTSAEVKNMRIYTSTPPYVFMA